ncbi:MAG: zinc permease, partial [Cyclobacteriaceae bacterium]
MKMLVLFLVPMIAGLAIFVTPKSRSSNFKLMLVFAGSYLFAITVIHILPELYSQYQEVELIGLFVLLGFFLQQFLEYFTSGVEHGHIHSHDHQGHAHSHVQSEISALVLLSALCVH